MEKNGKRCGCPHHKMIPVLMILFAITFLLEAFEILSSHIVSIVWPILVGVAGVIKLGGSSCACCDQSDH